MWEAFEHAAFYGLDNLTAIIDVNRLGQRGETMHGWDLDSYADRAQAFGWHAIEIDGHDVDAIDRAYGEARRAAGQPTVIVARTLKGKGVKAVEDKPGWHGKALDHPERGDRRARRRAQHRRRRGEAGARRAARLRRRRPAASCRRWELGEEVATRQAYGEALAALGSTRAATWSRSTARSRTRPTPRSSARPTPTGTSRCTSPSSRWSRPRSGCRCASWVPFASTFAAFLSPRLRLHPHGRDQPGEHPALRLARRRLDRRGRAVADGARGPGDDARRPRLDRALPERRQPDRQAGRRDGRPRRDRLPAHDPRGDAGRLRRRRGVPGRRLARAARGRRHRDRRRRDHAARVAEGGRAARRRGHRGARDRPLLGQAGRRRDAACRGRGDRRPDPDRRGPLAARAGSATRCSRRSPTARLPRAWCGSPCATCPARASPPSCWPRPGSTPSTSPRRARSLVGAAVGSR